MSDIYCTSKNRADRRGHIDPDTSMAHSPYDYETKKITRVTKSIWNKGFTLQIQKPKPTFHKFSKNLGPNSKFQAPEG
jgi:hypothetical protein